MRPRRRIALLSNHLGAEGLYQHRLWRAAAATCAKHGIDLVVYTGLMVVYDYPSHRAMAELLQRLDRSQIDGVLFTPGLEYFSNAVDLAELVRRYSGMAMVSLVQELPGVPVIGVDNGAGMQAMVEHLIVHHGCRRMVFVSGPPQARDGVERLVAWHQTVQAHGLAPDDQLVLPGDFVKVPDLPTLSTRWRAGQRFDAVVAANDQMAVEVVQHLQAAGIRVPEDVAVVGFDDNVHDRLGSPRLSSVAQPLVAQVQAAIDHLRQQWGDLPTEAEPPAPLRCVPVFRNSCGCTVDHGEALDRFANLLQRASAQGDGVVPAVQQALASSDDRVRTALDAWAALGHPSWQSSPAPAAEREAARGAILAEVVQATQHSLTASGLRSQEAFDILHRTLQAGEVQGLGPLLLDCLPRLGLTSFALSVFPEVLQQLGLDTTPPDDAQGAERHEDLVPLVACVAGTAMDLPADPHPLTGLGPPAWIQRLPAGNLALLPIVSELGWFGVLSLRLDVGNEQVAYHVQGALSALFQRDIRANRAAAEHERELRRQLAQSERARTLDELVRGLAHEINTPLGNAIASASLVRDGGHQAAQRMQNGSLTKRELQAHLDRSQQALDLTGRSLERIAELVRTLKKAVVTEYSGDPVRVRLDQLVAQVLSLHRAEMALRFIALETELPATETQLLPSVMVEVVSALVSNALDHAFSAKRLLAPCLQVRLSTLDTGDLQLVIEDNGVGVPDAMLPRLFLPFASHHRADGHRGLGLAMVSNLVAEGLGGRIHHEVPDNGGSRFVLRFPQQRATPWASTDPADL